MKYTQAKSFFLVCVCLCVCVCVCVWSRSVMSNSLRPHGPIRSPSGSSVHGILQARILEWVATSLSRGYSQPRDLTQVSSTVGRCFILWATREAPLFLLPFAFHSFYVLSSSHLMLNIRMIPKISFRMPVGTECFICFSISKMGAIWHTHTHTQKKKKKKKTSNES